MRRLRLALAICLLGTVLAVPAGTIAGARARSPAARSAVAESATRWAVHQVGVRELGTTNCGRAVVAWQRDARWRVPPCRPWCGAFVHEAFLRGGVDLRSAFLYPGRVLDDARAGHRRLRAIPVRSVRRGDLVIYAWGTGHRADHFGIVTRPYGRGSGVVHTVEGNSAQAVRIKARPLRYAVTGVRVDTG